MAKKGIAYLREHYMVLPALTALCCALAALALGGASVGDARAAVQPPVGRPDLSQMALQVTHLPPGTSVKHLA
jgi:hypothetical protein